MEDNQLREKRGRGGGEGKYHNMCYQHMLA